MNELKSNLATLKSLAKELMKIGNISEYFNTLKEVNALENQLLLVKI
jgi:hypothetical protein